MLISLRLMGHVISMSIPYRHCKIATSRKENCTNIHFSPCVTLPRPDNVTLPAGGHCRAENQLSQRQASSAFPALRFVAGMRPLLKSVPHVVHSDTLCTHSTLFRNILGTLQLPHMQSLNWRAGEIRHKLQHLTPEQKV